MPAISVVLVCDGTSDICIQDIIQWIVDENFSELTFRIQVAREVIPAHTTLSARIKRAYEIYEPDILVCHRDAENQTLAERTSEILEASAKAELPISVVPAIPIKIVESWLLTSSQAIRMAANNRNGTHPIGLPNQSRIEDAANPKQLLFSSLKSASGLPSHRMRKFDVHQARSRITSYIDSFHPLREQEGFRKFEESLVAAITEKQE